MAKVGIILRSKAHRCSFRQNLSPIIDIDRVGQLKTRVRRNQSIQIDHRSAFLPDKCAQEVSAVGRATHNLSTRIQATATAARITSNGAEIVNLAVPPQNRIMKILSRQISRADNISGLVEPYRFRSAAA